jgi:NADPH:quinone reductase-like Zn-dependent oxidoreductase
MMKAVRIHSFGGPENAKLEEIALPKLKSDEALVRIRVAGVNPVDWMLREKIYVPEGQESLPQTLGQDFSGVIEKLPEGAAQSPDGLKVGDSVFGETWGTFAEFAAVPLRDLALKPPGLSFEDAAAIPMAGLTAYQMILNTVKAKPGMKILIHGASGPVGALAAQFAIWKGATVYATCGRESVEFLKGIGVSQVIDYKNERFEDKVEDVDVVIEHLGGEVQGRSWPVIKKGGMLINLIGELDQEAAQRAGVKPVFFEMKYSRDDLQAIAGLVEEGIIQTHVTRVLTLDDAREAMDLNQKGESHGKIVLKVLP